MVTVYHPAGNTRKAVPKRRSWLKRIVLLPIGLVLLAIPVRYIVCDERAKKQAHRGNTTG